MKPISIARVLRAVVVFLVASLSLRADTVTVPVAASLVGRGGVPFVSDVKVFNTSYADVLTVTATYRFGGQQASFQLDTREAKAFDDIGSGLFGAPNSFGAVEFVSSGSPGQLVVTSQLKSPASGGGHVGMFVPGLPSSAASAVTALTSLVNGESRTNVGIYNPNGVGVTATIRLFDGSVPLGAVPVFLGPHAITQQNDIYGLVGFGSLVRDNGYATVESSDPQSPLFTYAAEVDNSSGDLILIVGAEDVPAPAGFHPPTATPGGGGSPTPTPTPPAPTPTPTPTQSAGATRTVSIQNFSFQDTEEGGSTSHIRVGDSVKWVWLGGFHSTTSGPCPPCSQSGDGNWDSGAGSGMVFTHTFNSAGTFPYYCKVHTTMMTGTVVVSP